VVKFQTTKNSLTPPRDKASRLTKTPANAKTGTPGHVLRTFFMEPLGLSAYRVAKDIGVTPITLSQILHGRRAISAPVALRLGGYFGVEPNFWLSLQAHADLTREAATPRHNAVLPCEALNGRAFALKETKMNGARNWQVLIVKTRNNGARN